MYTSQDQSFNLQQQLLLDCSIISNVDISSHLDISLDKIASTSKERTRQESYQQVLRLIHAQKSKQMQLKDTLDSLRAQTYKLHLTKFKDEFEMLDKQNAFLRAQIKKYRKQIIQEKSQRQSNRSSIKPRSSINNTYGDLNRTTSKKFIYNTNNLILKKKEQKITQSSANLLGRSQVVSPIHHKRRQSQLTQRKNNIQNQFGTEQNIDEKSGQFLMRQSISYSRLRPQPKNENYFIKILEGMLQEQKMRDIKFYGQLYNTVNQEEKQKPKQQLYLVQQIEKQIHSSNQNIQMLTGLLNRFQKQIEQVNIHLKDTQQMAIKLQTVKGKYIIMEQKCHQLNQLRKQVNQKQEKLLIKRQKEAQGYDVVKNITSLQTMVKIILDNSHKKFPEGSSKLYCRYYKQIKQLFKWQKQQQNKRYFKITKIKQTIDSIRQSRKKMNQLIKIYQDRITKLQDKIYKIRNPSSRLESSKKVQ